MPLDGYTRCVTIFALWSRGGKRLDPPRSEKLARQRLLSVGAAGRLYTVRDDFALWSRGGKRLDSLEGDSGESRPGSVLKRRPRP